MSWTFCWLKLRGYTHPSWPPTRPLAYAAYRPHTSRGFRLAWAGKTLTARPHRTLDPPQCEILSPDVGTPPQTSCQPRLVDRQSSCSAVSTARSGGSSSCARVCRETGLHVLGPPCMAAQRTGPPPRPGDEPPGAKQGRGMARAGVLPSGVGEKAGRELPGPASVDGF